MLENGVRITYNKNKPHTAQLPEFPYGKHIACLQQQNPNFPNVKHRQHT